MNNKYLSLGFIKSSKKLVLTLICTFSLAIISFLLGGQLLASYNDSEDVKSEISKKEADIKTWNEQISFINEQQFRPVEEKSIDMVQTNIIMNLKSRGLNLTGLKTANSKLKNANTYELSFTGSYENTIRFLKDFHVKDILTSVLKVKMESTEGNVIKTTLLYVVYIK